MSFGKNLQILRKKNQLSQEGLAEMLGVSRQAVSKWEVGEGYPEVDKLLILSKKLNVSLDNLLGGENNPITCPYGKHLDMHGIISSDEGIFLRVLRGMDHVVTVLLAEGVIVLLAAVFLLPLKSSAYKQASQETATGMMAKNDEHIIVDVRSQEEYDAGHIPGAVLIPNETIGTKRPELLPDLDQIILLYCGEGNRSKEAARKLLEMGYKNVFDFGGINSWMGEPK